MGIVSVTSQGATKEANDIMKMNIILNYKQRNKERGEEEKLKRSVSLILWH